MNPEQARQAVELGNTYLPPARAAVDTVHTQASQAFGFAEQAEGHLQGLVDALSGLREQAISAKTNYGESLKAAVAADEAYGSAGLNFSSDVDVRGAAGQVASARNALEGLATSIGEPTADAEGINAVIGTIEGFKPTLATLKAALETLRRTTGEA